MQSLIFWLWINKNKKSLKLKTFCYVQGVQKSWGKTLGHIVFIKIRKRILINIYLKIISFRVTRCLVYESIVYSKPVALLNELI